MDWKRYGGALLLACVSLSVQAKIKSCDDEAVISQVSEIPGLPPTSASKAGDVLHKRLYLFSIGYEVVTKINGDRMRMGAGWSAAPDPNNFNTVRLASGLGVRWRHADSGLDGRLIGSGNSDINTWSEYEDYPGKVGKYTLQALFVQEFILTDPAKYQGGGGGYLSTPFSIYAHGTGNGASQNVSKGCNQSVQTGDVAYPKGVYHFIYDNWSGDALPPLPAPSCKLALDSRHLRVPMDAINVSGLDHKDAVSQNSVPLRIRLEECAINAKPSINFTDAGTPENTSHTLLPNNADAAGSAKGLGVRLRRNQQTDVYFGPPSSSDGSRRIALGTASSGNPVLTLDLNAYYVRTTAAPIQPGAFAATATFVVSYP